MIDSDKLYNSYILQFIDYENQYTSEELLAICRNFNISTKSPIIGKMDIIIIHQILHDFISHVQFFPI